jgi:hypothetical protein
MFNNRVAYQDTKTEKVASSVRRSKPEPVGRDRLKHFDQEVKAAQSAVQEMAERVERLEGIVLEADAAHRALQLAISNDGGVALTSYSAGTSPADSDIAKLVMAAETSARAATGAKAALPHAQSALENAKAQVIALGAQRVAELNRVISMLADDECRAYKNAFDDLGRRHDRLVGYASVAETNQGDVRLTQSPLAVPRFASPSLGTLDADPFLRHQPNPLDIGDAARMWKEIRGRLELDAGAEISDLIKTGATK